MEASEKPASNLTRVRLLDLGDGQAIWRVHIDLLREQDKNARVMDTAKFERLVANIRKEKRLESLRLCCPNTAHGQGDEFFIISGHHRVRAARAADVLEVYILVIETGLTKSRIRAKQLAHNALAGTDDMAILADLYREIEEIDARIESGITDKEMEAAFKKAELDDICLEIDYEILTVAFLPHQKQNLDEVLSLIEADGDVLVSSLDEWPHFRKAMQDIGRAEKIRALPHILHRMAELARAELDRIHSEANDGTPPEAS